MSNETLKNKVSAEEWETRVELATAYRAWYYLGYEYSIFGHLSARVPGEENALLLNPFGLGFDEITASSLVKVDKNKKILIPNNYKLNEAAWIIHSGILFNRTEINCAMHLHSPDGAAVSAQTNGFLPLCQDSVLFFDKIAYHDYEGIVVNPEEGPKLLKDLGNKKILILKNHGDITVGSSIAEAFFYLYMFEKACTIQIKAQTSGVLEISNEIIAQIPQGLEIVLSGLDDSKDKLHHLEMDYEAIFKIWKRRMKRIFSDLDS